jgi:AraC-like DNA-binding protein
MNWPHLLLLGASISFMLLQAAKPNKSSRHYLFALFCASMAMGSLQNLSAPTFGAYQYLIGLGACATCNMVWLISRALFREGRAIAFKHIAVAGVIALLIMLSKTNAFLTGLDVQTNPISTFYESISEVLNLLSSTILMLSLWEALRHFKSKSRQQQWQRGIFASAFVAGLASCMVIPTFFEPNMQREIMPYLVMFSAILIMLSIHVVIWMQDCTIKQNLQNPANPSTAIVDTKTSTHSPDSGVISAIEALVNDKQIYLQADIKISTLAQALNMPEYKISRAIRAHYKAPNFNAFINHKRIEHAKGLMVSKEAKTWSMLVVSLESGFASVVTFNRTFKAVVGYLPSEYKKLNQP